MKRENKREKDSIKKNKDANEKKVNKKKKKDEKIFIKTSGKVLGGRVYEQVKVTDKDSKPFFVYYNRLKRKFEGKKSLKDGNLVYIPYTNDLLIIKNVVKMPADIIESKDTDALISDIRDLMDKYVYIPDEVDKEIIITYVLLTWVYDRFSAIPYLRAIGELGTGKSRLLRVLSICYKSLSTRALASPAPIFRIIDKFGGTLILDEAELGKRSERNEDIKEILRSGKDSDGVILRCDPKTLNPIPYDVFGPKILGSRRPYSDDALESRIITIRMEEAKGDNNPILLEKIKFDKESDKLRAKLLAWRLKQYFKIDINFYKKYATDKISRRLNEMYAPLICVRAHDKKFIQALLDKALESHRKLLEDRSMSIEANIVREIIKIKLGMKDVILLKKITEGINEETGKRYSSRYIGGIIRNTLGLMTTHTREGSKVVWESAKIKKLMKDYNLKPEFKKKIKRYNEVMRRIKKKRKKMGVSNIVLK